MKGGDHVRTERGLCQTRTPRVNALKVGDPLDESTYGGVKDSGLGREGIRFAMDEGTVSYLGSICPTIAPTPWRSADFSMYSLYLLNMPPRCRSMYSWSYSIRATTPIPSSFALS